MCLVGGVWKTCKPVTLVACGVSAGGCYILRFAICVCPCLVEENDSVDRRGAPTVV
jgi:hypothetical protein